MYCTVLQFAGLIIEEAVAQRERAKMLKPLTDEEFDFVSCLNGSGTSCNEQVRE